MPAAPAIPSSDKVAGVSTGETADLNGLYAAASLLYKTLGTSLGVLGGTDAQNIAAVQALLAQQGVNNTPLVGVVPTGDSTGVKDQATVQALLNLGSGRVELGAGTFYFKANGVTATNPPQYIDGQGYDLTKIYLVGSGDCISMQNPVAPGGGFETLTVFGGGVRRLTILGDLTTAKATGLHIGDGWGYDVDVFIRNFAATSDSCNLHLDNRVFWTEKGRFNVHTWNSPNLVIIEDQPSTGMRSFEYNDFTFYMSANAGQQGITLQNGAYLSGCSLTCRGNFNGSASTPMTTSWLNITGSDGLGNFSHIAETRFDVSLEQNNSVTHTPQTILFNAGNNTLQGCTGKLTFLDTWTPSNIDATTSTRFQFFGRILGDSNLAAASVPTAPGHPAATAAGTPVVYAKNVLNGSTGVNNDGYGDFFECTLSANITVGLGAGSSGCIPGPQRKTYVFHQAAAGGPYTVTWPTSGSATVTTPNVIWPGNNPPAMRTTASTTDVYVLETLDGATWYGRTQLNESTAAILANGVGNQGSAGKPADAGHVHPMTAPLSLYVAPTNVLAETGPRMLASSTTSALTSGTLTIVGIGLPIGALVSNITFCVRSTAAGTVTDGWYVLLDSGLVVRAVTVDQGAGQWATVNTSYTLAVAAPYTTTYSGIYYLGIMVAAATPPNLASFGVINGLNSSPTIAATSSTGQTTPPTVGTTMGSLTGANGFTMYANVS